MKSLLDNLLNFKNFSIKQHLLIGFITWIIGFILITGFSYASHPENAAPYSYFVASMIGLVFLIMASRKNIRWANIFVFIMIVLLMLDESAYGTEVFGWEPIYWERHNYEIYDLHNFLFALPVIIRIELENANWDFAMFESFWKSNQIIAGLLVFYVGILRVFMARKSEDIRREFSFNLGLVIFILFAVGTVYQLLVIPKDPKNIWFFGLSKSRLLLIVSVILFIVFQLMVYFDFRESKARMLRAITQSMNNSGSRGWIPVVLGLAVITVIAYQIIIPFRPFPDIKAIFVRVTPIAFLLEIGLGLMGLFLISWEGIFTQPISAYWKMLVTFLDRYPAYIYLGFAILQILIAQLVDRELIHIDKFIPIKNWPGVNTWNTWMEESFEMIASFEFMLAGLTFYFNRSLVKENSQKLINGDN